MNFIIYIEYYNDWSLNGLHFINASNSFLIVFLIPLIVPLMIGNLFFYGIESIDYAEGIWYPWDKLFWDFYVYLFVDASFEIMHSSSGFWISKTANY
jgi:hypothetical protein